MNDSLKKSQKSNHTFLTHHYTLAIMTHLEIDHALSMPFFHLNIPLYFKEPVTLVFSHYRVFKNKTPFLWFLCRLTNQRALD